MSEPVVRRATRADLNRITEIYNHYILNTPITFDIGATTAGQRIKWFEEHNSGGRYQLFVAEHDGSGVGYAGPGPFRDKTAYDTSAAVQVYCAPEAAGKGIGSALYRALFGALRSADLHRLLAGITLPNDASVALHRRFGFTEVGIFNENGRKFDRYWDVLWMQRPLVLAS